MLKTHLNTIKDDLSKHHHNKQDLLEYYIQLRLNKTLKTYYKDLSNVTSHLMTCDAQGLLKRL